MKPDADAGPAELDGESHLAHLHAPADVVGLHFFGAASLHARGFMGHARIREGTAHHARPAQLIRLKRRSGANIRLRVEAQPEKLEGLA